MRPSAAPFMLSTLVSRQCVGLVCLQVSTQHSTALLLVRLMTRGC